MIHTQVNIKVFSSGSVHYADAHDDVVFFSEWPVDDVAEKPAELDLCQHFLRHHLVRNGRPSMPLVPLMRDGCLGPLICEVVSLHTQEAEGEDADPAATLQQTQKVLNTMSLLLKNRAMVVAGLQSTVRPGQ